MKQYKFDILVVMVTHIKQAYIIEPVKKPLHARNNRHISCRPYPTIKRKLYTGGVALKIVRWNNLS